MHSKSLGDAVFAELVLDVEAQYIEVGESVRSRLRDILGSATELTIPASPSREDAILVFREIDDLLARSGVRAVGPPYVTYVRDALTPVSLSASQIAEVESSYLNARRRAARSGRGEYLLGDCDTLSALVVSIAEIHGVEFRLVDRQPSAFGGDQGHTWVAWRLSDGRWLHWDPLSGTEYWNGRSGRILSRQEGLAYFRFLKAEMDEIRRNFDAATKGYAAAFADFPRRYHALRFVRLAGEYPEITDIQRARASAAANWLESNTDEADLDVRTALAAYWAAIGNFDKATRAQAEIVKALERELATAVKGCYPGGLADARLRMERYEAHDRWTTSRAGVAPHNPPPVRELVCDKLSTP